MQNKITAVLVDDVSSALDNLKDMIADFIDNIEIIGTADGVISGTKLIRQLQPDIAFLDIEMPDGTGFDILDLLPSELDTKIIFTTGSEAYAIQAFRYAAVDYLLKPIDADDLRTAIDKAMTKSVSTDIMKQVFADRNEMELPRRIALHTSDEIVVVSINEIVRCQSLDNYCHIYLESGRKILMSKPLKYYADLLEPMNFIRVHQSHLIHFDAIQSFVKKEGGYLLLKDNSQIPVSIRKRSELFERLNKG